MQNVKRNVFNGSFIKLSLKKFINCTMADVQLESRHKAIGNFYMRSGSTICGNPFRDGDFNRTVWDNYIYTLC